MAKVINIAELKRGLGELQDDVSSLKNELLLDIFTRLEELEKNSQREEPNIFYGMGDILFTTKQKCPNGTSFCNGAYFHKTTVPLLYQAIINKEIKAVSFQEYGMFLGRHRVCPMFGIDEESEVIRIPTINSNAAYIKPADQLNNFSFKEQSLPNVTGSVNYATGTGGTGPFYGVAGWGDWCGTAKYGANFGSKFDLSRVSDIYKDGANVEVNRIELRPYVVLEPTYNLEIDMTESIKSNNPFFFGMYQTFTSAPENAAWLLSDGDMHDGNLYESFYQWLIEIKTGQRMVDGISIKSVDEDYSDYDYVIDTALTRFRLPLRAIFRDRHIIEQKLATEEDTDWYTIYNDGYIEQGGRFSNTTGNAVINTVPLIKEMKDTSYYISITRGVTGAYNSSSSLYYSNSPYDLTTSSFKFYSHTGAGLNTILWTVNGYLSDIEIDNIVPKLYFFVGDTIKNADVINVNNMIGKINSVNSKLNYRHVVEKYKSGNSWCIVYNDGWCEQGGIVVNNSTEITFIKEFATTDYLIFASTQLGNGYSTPTTKTTTGFKCGGSTNTTQAWEAKGWLAESEYNGWQELPVEE